MLELLQPLTQGWLPCVEPATSQTIRVAASVAPGGLLSLVHEWLAWCVPGLIHDADLQLLPSRLVAGT